MKICECDHGEQGHERLTGLFDGARGRCLTEDCKCENFVYDHTHELVPGTVQEELFRVINQLDEVIRAELTEAQEDGKTVITASSAVDHPSHYGGADDPYEHIKVAEALGWGYHIGNCTKYLWRAGKKDRAKVIEDLEKARWYLDRFITLLKNGPS